VARPWSSSVVWSIWGSCPIGTAVASGHLSFDFVDQMFVDHPPLTGKTFREIAEELGLPLETLTRLYAMWGLPRPAPEDVVREDDAPTFSEWKAFFPPQALNEQLLTQGARLFGEATSRLADWGASTKRANMHSIVWQARPGIYVGRKFCSSCDDIVAASPIDSLGDMQ